MKKYMALCCAALLLFSVMALAQEKKEESKLLPSRDTPVAVTVTTDKKIYLSGQPVKISIQVRNKQKEPVSLRFSSGQKYDVEIRRGKGNTGEKVWQWSEGRMFTMMLATVRMQPGKEVSYAETYGGPEGKDARGNPLPALKAGTYTLVATLTTMDRTPRPFGTTSFTVR